MSAEREQAMSELSPRKGMPSPQLSEREFRQRFLDQFQDPAFAALIRDLSERDMLDSTLVLCTSEFGRTPRINAGSGRDHWPTGFSLVLAGGGIQGGRVFGETDPAGSPTPKDPVNVDDLAFHAKGGFADGAWLS